MATGSWVIKLSRVDQDNQPILVHVSNKTNGHALDLDLLATDGESAFRTKIRERKLDKLKSSGYDGTPEEWSSILHYVLYPATAMANSISERLRDTLDVTCAISEQDRKSSLNIIIRQSVEGISHKFGTVQLPVSDNTDDVDLFGWATEIADERDALAKNLRVSNARMEEAKRTIESLEEQLHALIAAKEEHETQLLSKFALLLNEKKLRIRSQQRLLVEQQTPPRSRSAQQAKSTEKRKALDQVGSADSSDSEAFDAMDVDKDNHAKMERSEDGRSTSSGNSATDNEVNTSRSRSFGDHSSKDTPTIPPPRELPFVTDSKSVSTKIQQRVANTSNNEGDETASEDDEL